MTPSIFRTLFILLLISLFGVSLINVKYLKRMFSGLFSNFKAPYIAWIMLFFGIFLISERNPVYIVFDKNVLFQITMVSLAGLIILMTYISRIVQTMANMNIVLFCLLSYGVVGVVSGLYSPNAILSVYKSIIIIIDICVCAVVLSYQPNRYYVKKFINLTYLFYTFLLISVILGAIIRPDLALEPKPYILGFILGGVLPIMNPNDVAFVAGIICLVAINRLFDDKYTRIVKLLFVAILTCALVVLILGQARTSIIAFLISFFLILFIRKKVGLMVASFLIIGALLVGGAFPHLESYFKRGQTQEQFISMSGRIHLWAEGWERVKEAPVLGYGMASTRFKTVISKFSAGHMHNAFLEVLINTGFMGFIFWLVALIFVASRIILYLPRGSNSHDKTLAIDMVALMVYSLIRMWTGQTFVQHNYSFFLFICLIAYSCLIQKTKYNFSR